MKEINNLTIKQRRFVDEYLITKNATKAALNAGYSARSAYSQGARLLKNDVISNAISVHLSEAHMTADEVLQGLAEQARGDMADLMDISFAGFTFKLAWKDPVTGELVINPKTKLIKKIKQKVTTYIAKKESDEDREVIETELELYSAQEAFALLGKYHGLFVERHEIAGKDGERLSVIFNLVSPDQKGEDKPNA